MTWASCPLMEILQLGKRRDGGPLAQGGWVEGTLSLAVLFCCSSIHVSRLEPELRAQIHQQNPSIEVVYYNKGL